MRASGILLPVASLPSRYGIGCFSKEAYEFVDRLEEAGQSYWQILPLGPTGYGDSPYQSFSTFAGNPYFIDLETLVKEGLLTEEECDACDFGDNAFCDEFIDVYLARDLVKSTQHLDEGEAIDVEAHDVDELCEMIYAGKIQDSKTVSAILAYKNLLNKDSGKA